MAEPTPTVTGKTGADAINRFIDLINKTYNRYALKFRLAIAIAVAGGAISSAEADAIVAFIDSIPGLVVAMRKFADYVGTNS